MMTSATGTTPATGKVALVTGGNKGIGFEIVRGLAAGGAIVYLAARDEARGLAAARDLAQAAADGGGAVRVVVMDVTRPDTITAAARRIRTEAGRLDILVNNAAIVAETLPPSQAVPAAVRETFDVNVIGPLMVTQAMLPLLRTGEVRVIANVSSDLGSLTLHQYPEYPYGDVNIFAYNASKTALNAFTVLLAKELATEGFKVNAVNPGFTATDMNGHTGTRAAADAAGTVLCLALIGPDGPTGGFFTEGGRVPW